MSSVCRVCFKDNMRMLPIEDTPYQEIYERYTATKLIMEHGWPLLVCYLCASQLRKFKRFVKLSQHNEVRLYTLAQGGIQLSSHVLTKLVQTAIHNYSISGVRHTSVSDGDTSDSYNNSPVSYVKEEHTYETEIGVKPEQADDLSSIEDAPPCFVRSLSPTDDFKPDPDPDTQTKTVHHKTKTTLKRELYPCEYCDLILKTEKSLKQHLKNHAKRLKENRSRKLKSENSCMKCDKKFSNINLFRKHMRVHKPFVCDQCPLMFRRKDELNRHVETHTREKPFACTECGEKFLKKYTLKRHMTVHTQKPLHTCEICNQHFIYKSRLAVHAQSHTNEKPFSCDTCKRRFTSKNTLNIHMKTHKGETFACSICMKAFKYKCSLKLHLKTHSEYDNLATQIGEVFKCNACETLYKNKNKLKKHITNTHSEYKTNEIKNTDKDSATVTSQVEAIVTCDLCDQKFNSKHNLKIHIVQAHDGLKHPCPKCGRQFQYKYRVTKHLRICTGERQTGTRIFKCDICNRVFNTKRNLKNHVMIHTGEKPFVCDRCGKKFRHKVNLTKHALLHTGEQYPCEHCDKKFNSREYLKVHNRVHTGKMFPCELCEWKFTRTSELRAHRRVHTGERPFPCEVCNKHFSQKSKLKLHISRMHGEETERNKNYFKGLGLKV